MAKITIIIKKNGKIIIDAQGFQGAKCLEATRKLEELLSRYGISMDSKQIHLKPEYYETEVHQETKIEG